MTQLGDQPTQKLHVVIEKEKGGDEGSIARKAYRRIQGEAKAQTWSGHGKKTATVGGYPRVPPTEGKSYQLRKGETNGNRTEGGPSKKSIKNTASQSEWREGRNIRGGTRSIKEKKRKKAQNSTKKQASGPTSHLQTKKRENRRDRKSMVCGIFKRGDRLTS